MSLASFWASHLFVSLSCYRGRKVNSERNAQQGCREGASSAVLSKVNCSEAAQICCAGGSRRAGAFCQVLGRCCCRCNTPSPLASLAVFTALSAHLFGIAFSSP